jgi:tetratricopeptide (TPR) repeat protein
MLTQRFNSAFGSILPLLGLGLSVLALFFAFQRTERTQLVIEGQEIDAEGYNTLLDRSVQTMERAEDALSSVELVLSFLEGASVLAGVILVGVGILGINSLQDLRSDTEKLKQDILERLVQAERELTDRVERAEKEFLSRAEHLATLERELEGMYQKTQSLIGEQVRQANVEAKRSFEALSHLVMGQRLVRERNINAAIQACRSAYELDPDNIPNNYLLGRLLIRTDQLDEAIFHLTEALDEAEEDPKATAPTQAVLGLAIRKKGDRVDDLMERNRIYNQAESYLIRATTDDPQLLNEDGESYFGVLGSLYRRQGRDQDAIMAYERAARATPRRSYPEINLAMLYLEREDQGQFERHRRQAETKSRRRLQDTPEDYWAIHDLALALLLRGDVETAYKHFEEALEITPDVMTLDSVIARLEFAKELPQPPQGVEGALELFAQARKKLA